jgi:CYTH domain-containing protein
MENNQDQINVNSVTEIERRFLLSSIPPEILREDILVQDIYQAYYKKEDSNDVVRVRKTTNNRTFESKYEQMVKRNISKGVNHEIGTKELTEEEFMTGQHGTFLGAVSKTRYTEYDVWFDSDIDFTSKAELDVIDVEGFTSPLIILEVEVGRLDFDLEFPKWLKPYVIMEITGCKELSNFAIALSSLK